jgi:hypothetical protein
VEKRRQFDRCSLPQAAESKRKVMYLQQIKKVKNRLLFCFPSKLPVGMKDFNAFADSIFETYGLPKEPSYYHTIATMIMHLGPTTAYKSKRFFAFSIIKAMANQIAYGKIQELKEKQKAEADAKAEENKKQNDAEAATDAPQAQDI